MFGLSEAHWNIVKRQARKLNDGISALPVEDRKKEQIVIAVINEHYEPVKAIIERMKFVWTAGYLAGRCGNKTGDYE